MPTKTSRYPTNIDYIPDHPTNPAFIHSSNQFIKTDCSSPARRLSHHSLTMIRYTLNAKTWSQVDFLFLRINILSYHLHTALLFLAIADEEMALTPIVLSLAKRLAVMAVYEMILIHSAHRPIRQASPVDRYVNTVEHHLTRLNDQVMKTGVLQQHIVV